MVPGLSCKKEHNEVNPSDSRQKDTEVLSRKGGEWETHGFLF